MAEKAAPRRGVRAISLWAREQKIFCDLLRRMLLIAYIICGPQWKPYTNKIALFVFHVRPVYASGLCIYVEQEKNCSTKRSEKRWRCKYEWCCASWSLWMSYASTKALFSDSDFVVHRPIVRWCCCFSSTNETNVVAGIGFENSILTVQSWWR